LIAALAASGLPTDSFQFLGFLPAKSGQRRTMLETLRHAEHTTVVYEAPHRIAETIKDIVELLGPGRPVVLARELTKIHEEFIRGTSAQVLQRVQEHELKGEITLLIGKGAGQEVAAKDIAQHLNEIMREQKLDEKAGLKVLAKERGLSKSEAYRELQRLRKK
jgi:16S rRNA (cytidine1402-2'-O)-methyltransferase